MKKAFKFRLYPNRSQTEALETMLETHRRLYNDALAERRNVYESEQRTVSYGEQSGHLKEARKSNPFLAATNFSSTQATLRRLDRAFKAFFRRIKCGEAPGYPRFKGRDRFDTVEFPSYGDGCKLKDNGRLYLQHVGHVKAKIHRPTVGTIKTVSVKRQCGKWYVVFVCDIGDAPEPATSGPQCGLDLGLKSFLVTDSGESVSPPQHYRKAQKRLRRASRALSRRVKVLTGGARPGSAWRNCMRKSPTNAETFTTRQLASWWKTTVFSRWKLSTSKVLPGPGLQSLRMMLVGHGS